MNWIDSIEQAIEYIEKHLTEKIDYEQVAKQAFSSSYHFQRVFGITCGLTLGDYIRRRRLTLAGQELAKKNSKVIDIALKYGYETPESFTRAFTKFHGVTPSKAKTGVSLKSFPKLTVNIDTFGACEMNYSIEEKDELVLVGYKKRFSGVPYGRERTQQEEQFFRTTRAKQWLLIGASANYENDYCIVTNIDDDGYDFYIAYEVDDWTRQEMFNPQITGVDFMDKLGFEIITIPKQTYAVFKTPKIKSPTDDYADIRRRIITEWLPNSNFTLSNAPEVVAFYWRVNQKKDWASNRHIEIRLPIEK